MDTSVIARDQTRFQVEGRRLSVLTRCSLSGASCAASRDSPPAGPRVRLCFVSRAGASSKGFGSAFALASPSPSGHSAGPPKNGKKPGPKDLVGEDPAAVEHVTTRSNHADRELGARSCCFLVLLGQARKVRRHGRIYVAVCEPMQPEDRQVSMHRGPDACFCV